jgi:acylphosphatase
MLHGAHAYPERPAGKRLAMSAVQRRVVVHGQVQGVFFRATLRDRARSAGVSGWARNRSDGAVEAVLEGEPDAVERLVTFCREGPRGASVERVDVEEAPAEGLEGFDTR